MPISKRAKQRLRMMTAADKKVVSKAATTLFNCELLGEKRAREIIRWCEKARFSR